MLGPQPGMSPGLMHNPLLKNALHTELSLWNLRPFPRVSATFLGLLIFNITIIYFTWGETWQPENSLQEVSSLQELNLVIGLAGK